MKTKFISKNREVLLSTFVALILATFFFANANADQVILDDLIVDGSACIGFDCVNGESFGFDTLRLKENNLRIRAQDTSSSASFPSNDWQITFNDSANGGANKFSIDDIDGGRTPFTLEAEAPSHSLYVDDGGRLGLGTSTPVVQIHVKDGNTPTLRLEQDGSSGFTPQTWDVAGNEANFFIRDATNGSTLPFRIFPGAPTNSLTIAANGGVGFNTTNSNGVEVITALISHQSQGRDAVRFGLIDGTPRMILEDEGTIWQLDNLQGTLRYVDGTVVRQQMYASGFVAMNSDVSTNPLTIGISGGVTDDGEGAYLSTVGIWTNASSRNHKKDISGLDAAVAITALKELNPVTYRGKNDPSGEQYVGFIAEDIPDLMAVPGRTGVAAIEVVAVLTKVVQEQQKMIEKLNTQLGIISNRMVEF